ncbi:MAG: undecaprenyl-diphosphate phosphatase [Christensenellaceae bacterium]
MDIFQSVILGLVQGATEFLPVSSSGHLILMQNVLGVGTVPLLYDVMLHVGTLVAVVIVLWKEIVALLSHPIKNKLGMLIIATIPAIAMTLISNALFPEGFTAVLNGEYLAYGFFATAAVLVISESIAGRIEARKSVHLKEAVVMGVMQAAAIIPGLSRSGSTISGGLFMGVKRETAAKFAFLMSIPAILGGLVLGVKDVADNGMGDVTVLPLVIGVIVAFVSGFLAIKFMLSLISKYKLYGFAVYVAALGAFLLIDQNIRHLLP